MERAGGNPLFLEELARHVALASGKAGEEWGAAIPETLAGLLMQRVDALSPRARRAAETAAVAGRRFDAVLLGEGTEAALAELQGTDLEAVQGRLDEVDQLTKELQERERLDAVDPKWTLRVQELHSQLCSVIGAAKTRMSSQLEKAGQGRRALRGYGGKGAATGRYHRSEG